jgi:hypothetical protein
VRQIEVDDRVYAEIARRALPFVDREPNDTLRRVLGVSDAPQDGAAGEGGGDPTAAGAARAPEPAGRARLAAAGPRRGQRVARVQLSALVADGWLTRGESLICVDASGTPVPGGVATVGTGNKLVRDGQWYSMSRLAIELLRAAGHQVDGARGPAHWRTADGRTLLDLWRARLAAAGAAGGGAAAAAPSSPKTPAAGPR